MHVLANECSSENNHNTMNENEINYIEKRIFRLRLLRFQTCFFPKSQRFCRPAQPIPAHVTANLSFSYFPLSAHISSGREAFSGPAPGIAYGPHAIIFVCFFF